MCGPLVLAFPARHGGFGAHLLYHAGRIATYTLVGVLLGSLGAGIAHYGTQDSLVWTARIQLVFASLAALFLLFFGLSKLGFVEEPKLLSLANPARIPGFTALKRRLLGISPSERDGPPKQQKRPMTVFFLGLLLGLLPCGLSFAAFAHALAAKSAISGGLMTLTFGIGTLPSLLLVGLSASRLTARHRRLSDLIAGMLMIGMALVLVLDATRLLGG
jgi:sulfite exporter TauE/SafE